ncbi:MAG: hypothetical protein NC910_04400 [Candidatus Omnitrophica bacterium]|nr:hypothetical protein [Candidatus Omnitrophota bacterium]
MRIPTVFLLAFVLLSALSCPVGARAEFAVEDEKTDLREVIGQLVHVGKRSISVEFSRSKGQAEEMLIPITSETKLKSPLKSLAELQRGDTVEVKYKQAYRLDREGTRIVTKTAAVQIGLVKQTLKGAYSSREQTAP